MSVHAANKQLVEPLRAALRSANEKQIRKELEAVFAPDAKLRLGYPIGELTGPGELWAHVYEPLLATMPDFEKGDFIVMAGARWGEGKSGYWVGLGGNIVGTFSAPFLGIPATGRPVFMRYHEYYRIEDARICEMEALWDIPQLILQAEAWPMPRQLGVEWMCPGPSTGQGVIAAPYDEAKSQASVRVVWEMLHDLSQGNAETPDHGLSGHWHPNAPWYGSTGIGTARGHAGIRDVVLKPFRRGLSDNIRHLDQGVFFGDHDLVAFTGWPSGTAVHSGEGFLGLAPTGKTFERRSLDFWRIENGMIRENWVMVDVLDIYRQLGVDVLTDIRGAQSAA